MQMPLDTWNGLNAYIITADERACQLLLTAEKAGKCRLTFLLRLHSRLNKLRADRERQELKALAQCAD